IQTLMGPTWATYDFPPTGMTAPTARAYGYNQNSDSWLYTQGLDLTGGTSYRLTFKYSNQSSFYTDALKVAYGSSAAASAMTTVLVDHAAINDGAVHEDVLDFTP